MKKRVVVALGHRALGTTLPEQKVAVKNTSKVIADLIEAGFQVAITHSNAPQVGMIHTAMNEFGQRHENYTAAPMSVCSAMSQGYIGYDLQNGIREELMNRGIYRTVSTVLTQVIVDPYDEAFYTPTKVLGRYMSAEEANEERKKGNYVIEEAGKGFRRVVSAPHPVKIVELDAVNALLDADQVVIAAGGGGIPVLEQDNHLKGASAVIDKDFASCLLAKELDADFFDHLNSSRKSGNQLWKRESGMAERSYSGSGKKNISLRTSLPKALCFQRLRQRFALQSQKEGRRTLITLLDKAAAGIAGETGTVIHK